jgi:hypothetical protein
VSERKESEVWFERYAAHGLEGGDDHQPFVRVFETPGAATGEAVPVRRDLFNGPRDEFWAIDPATGTIASV